MKSCIDPNFIIWEVFTNMISMPLKKDEVQDNLKCVEISGYENMPTVRLSSREDFLQMMIEKRVTTYYVKLFDSDKIKGLSDFIILDNGVAFLTYGYGYKSLKDIELGKTFGINGMSKEFGLDYNDNIVRKGNRQINDGFLYYYVKEHGYSDFSEFNDSFSKGFHSAGLSVEEYRLAITKGFKSYNDYEKFSNSGFKLLKDFQDATDHNIKDPKLYDIYKFLENFQKKLSLNSKDQVILYLILASSQERTIKLDKLVNSLRDIEKLFTGRYYNDSMEWYKQKYYDREDSKLEAVLLENGIFSTLGTYDKMTKTFNKFIGVPLFIDGSNVAYNNGSKKEGDKPSVRFIKMVIDASKKYGFSDIRVFHDANLQYIVEDSELLEKLKEEYKVEKVPGKTDADEFLIPISKKYEAFIVSNDQFRDYIEAHKKDEEYIRTHRIAFMIDEEDVIFNNFKYIENASVSTDKEFEKLKKLIRVYSEAERVFKSLF